MGCRNRDASLINNNEVDSCGTNRSTVLIPTVLSTFHTGTDKNIFINVK
jgi:hypothetical protein